MARQPDGDECSVRKRLRTIRSVTPEVPNGQRKAERIWITELARHLHCQSGELKRLARATNALHSCHTIRTGRVYFVYPETAMRLIASVRARQGEALSQGKDPVAHAIREGRRLLIKKGRLLPTDT